MVMLWHAFFLRPFSNAPRKKKKNEPLSKNGNCRIGRKTQNQIVRGHVGSGSSIRSIHRLHSIPLHCIAFHRSIPLHSTALHSIIIHTPLWEPMIILKRAGQPGQQVVVFFSKMDFTRVACRPKKKSPRIMISKTFPIWRFSQTAEIWFVIFCFELFRLVNFAGLVMFGSF